jgi:hypothetical protein
MLTEELEALIAANKAAIEELRAELYRTKEDVATVRGLVEGRNRSSASKRDMTDEDARNVMIGAFKDFNHRIAAEELCLTYAQVYSCRFEYTFKHVHKELRDSGWKNPWVKRPGVHKI